MRSQAIDWKESGGPNKRRYRQRSPNIATHPKHVTRHVWCHCNLQPWRPGLEMGSHWFFSIHVNSQLSWHTAPTIILLFQILMVHAKSATKKQPDTTIIKEKVVQQAIEIYEREQQKAEGERMGLRHCCRAAEDEYYKSQNIKVKINHNTVNARRNGRKSIHEAQTRRTSRSSYQQRLDVIVLRLDMITPDLGVSLGDVLPMDPRRASYSMNHLACPHIPP